MTMTTARTQRSVLVLVLLVVVAAALPSQRPLK
jgi:hypothetical protein